MIHSELLMLKVNWPAKAHRDYNTPGEPKDGAGRSEK